jgi:hypothetical protein
MLFNSHRSLLLGAVVLILLLATSVVPASTLAAGKQTSAYGAKYSPLDIAEFFKSAGGILSPDTRSSATTFGERLRKAGFDSGVFLNDSAVTAAANLEEDAVFFFSGHGYEQALLFEDDKGDKSYLANASVTAKVNYERVDQLDLSQLQVAILAACLTAGDATGTRNMLSTFVGGGTWCGIGFKESMNAQLMAKWCDSFGKYAVEEGKEVGEAAQKAAADVVSSGRWGLGANYSKSLVILRHAGKDEVYISRAAGVGIPTSTTVLTPTPTPTPAPSTTAVTTPSTTTGHLPMTPRQILEISQWGNPDDEEVRAWQDFGDWTAAVIEAPRMGAVAVFKWEAAGWTLVDSSSLMGLPTLLDRLPSEGAPEQVIQWVRTASEPTPSGLPSAVGEMWAGVLAAAQAKDYEGLEALALQGPGEFSYTFGGPEKGPAAYWRAEAARGEDVLGILEEILRMPYGKEGDLYVWPEAYLWEVPFTSEQRELLAQNFSEDDITGWEDFGGYVGYRVGITQDGDWTFFVVGD